MKNKPNIIFALKRFNETRKNPTKRLNKIKYRHANTLIMMNIIMIWRILKKKKNLPPSSYRKFIFSQMVAAFSMLSSWLGVNRKAPFVRKSVSLISESVSWSCQSADARRSFSWFNRSNELLFDVDMSFSHVALTSWPLCDIFYRKRDRWDRFRRSKATRYGRSTPRKTRTRRIVGQLRIDTLLLYLIVDLPCPRSASSSIEMVVEKKK